MGRGPRGREEGARVGDLFRLRLAADRDDVLGDLVRALAGQPGVGLHVADRVGEAGVDVVHRDPVRAQGPGQGLGERPQAALGRIEILKDGAAATYGSEAIGGVVNFITRRDLDGIEMQADYSAVKDTDGNVTGVMHTP